MDYYEEIRKSILSGEAGKTSKLVEKSICLKYPTKKILEEGLIQGINIIANKFKYEDVLIPEVLMSTRALHAGLRTLNKYICVDEKQKHKAKIIIGTVSGDIHDIGKNIVKVLISTLNTEIIDLGVDVSSNDFIKAIIDEKPTILMMSCLLTTTMNEMRIVIDELNKLNLRDKVSIFIGGSPISESFRQEIGADYYFEQAIELKSYLDENINKFINK